MFKFEIKFIRAASIQGQKHRANRLLLRLRKKLGSDFLLAQNLRNNHFSGQIEKSISMAEAYLLASIIELDKLEHTGTETDTLH